MTRETTNHQWSRNSGSKWWKYTKRAGWALAVTLWLIWWTWTAALISANSAKNADKEKYWSLELKDKHATTLDAQKQNELYLTLANWERDTLLLKNFFKEILIQNKYLEEGDDEFEESDSITITELLSTMISENALKTEWFKHKVDEKLEEYWVERSENNNNLLGLLLGKIKNWSYWWFQTQREAIENGYWKDEERYTNICRKIANFKLPDANQKWKRIELYRQLWYENIEAMIKDLKDKKLDIYTWWGRLGIAYWIVLLNEQKIDRNKGWEKFNEIETLNKIKSAVSELEASYRNYDNLTDEETEHYKKIKEALASNWRTGERLQTIYLKKEDWKVRFDSILNALQSWEFRAWEITAWRCTSTAAQKNWTYQMISNIWDLNKWFEWQINWTWSNWLNLTLPDGDFWKNSVKEISQFINIPDEILEKGSSAVIKYLDENPELIEQLKNEIIKKYIQNFRIFFLLNEDWNSLNLKQMIFLEENLNISFNHLYIWARTFKNYLKEKNKTEVIKNFDILWDKFTKEQDKESLASIKKILTHKNSFMEFTGLSEEAYNKYIKFYFGPMMEWASILISQTWNVVPFLQKKGTDSSNEVNTAFRFSEGSKNELQRLAQGEKWTPYEIHEGENNIDSIKAKIINNKKLHDYISTHCWNKDGEPIDSIDRITPNLIYHFTGLSEAEINKLEKWDTIYFKTKGFEQYYEDSSQIMKAKKGEYFQKIIIDYMERNPWFAKIVKNIVGKDTIEERDISIPIIKQLVRHQDGSIRNHPQQLQENEMYIIVYPLNRSPKSSIQERIIQTPQETLDSLYNKAQQKIAEDKAAELKRQKEIKRQQELQRRQAQQTQRTARRQQRATRNTSRPQQPQRRTTQRRR